MCGREDKKSVFTRTLKSGEEAKSVRGGADLLFGYYRIRCSTFSGFSVRGGADFTSLSMRGSILVLKNLNPEIVCRDIGVDTILLCWERQEKFCNRHIVAQWLSADVGVSIVERVAAE